MTLFAKQKQTLKADLWLLAGKYRRKDKLEFGNDIYTLLYIK